MSICVYVLVCAYVCVCEYVCMHVYTYVCKYASWHKCAGCFIGLELATQASSCPVTSESHTPLRTQDRKQEGLVISKTINQTTWGKNDLKVLN